jgi:hypothetical protein
MTEVEKLLAIEEIKQVFARRVRALDMKLWDLYANCHTDDIVGDSYGGLPADKQPTGNGQKGTYKGILQMIALIRNMMEHAVPLISCHHAHTPEIEIISPTTATGVWPMEDHLWWQNGERQEWLHGYGHYHEQYRKVSGKWLISYRKLTRLHVEQTPQFYDRLYK